MIPQDFYKEEIRNDFKVTTKRKQVWATEIDLLEKFDECCKDNNLNYFVAGGTLLGAIRHKGFIPWDDDIDVIMTRQDYKKLVKIAPKYFKNQYCFQYYKTEKKYYKSHAQLRNSHTTAILYKDIDKKCSFNQGIFIDVFPLDVIPDKSDKRKRWINKITKIQKSIYEYDYYNLYKKHSILGKIRYALIKVIRPNNLMKYLEHVCSKYSNTNNKQLGDISFLGEKFNSWDRDVFSEQKEYPFECTKVKSVKDYDYFLRRQYKDYMQPVRDKSNHGVIFFDPDKSYTYYLNEGREELEKYANAEH